MMRFSHFSRENDVLCLCVQTMPKAKLKNHLFIFTSFFYQDLTDKSEGKIEL